MAVATSLIVSLGWAAAVTRADEPWEGPAFSADPAALFVAASSQAVPEGTEALVLIEEERQVFDAKGRKNYAWRTVYRVETDAAVEGWSSIQAAWEPWHQERPVFRARVITPDHVEHWLDPKTIAEVAAREDGRNLFSDRRVLRAPLPAVAAGSVVEEEIEARETAPVFDRGVVGYSYFGQEVPVRQTRVVIEAPTSLPLHYVTRLLPSVTPQKRESDGHVRLVFESGPTAPLERPEPFMPTDEPRRPYVAFSTGSTWLDVATRYAAMVDEQIHTADVKSLLVGIDARNNRREEVVAAVMTRLHREVRYTGVEFGEASLVPRTPAETLKRRYGDCKDKAALLIAKLRAAGIPAYMVLLNAAPGEDPEPELPGLGTFDHAIVYLPGSPDLWVDPTDEYASVGTLPLADQGRLSLVVRPESTALVRTPESKSTDNGSIETREVLLAELGPSRIVETTESWGSVGEGYREAYGGPDSKEMRKGLEDYAKAAYLAQSLTKYEHTKGDDFSGPFRLKLEMARATRGVSSRTDAVVAILLGGLISRLPTVVRKDPSEGDSTENTSSASDGNSTASSTRHKAHRKADLLLPEAHVVEWRYRIVPPPGFRARPLPEGGKQELGPALFSKEFAAAPDGVVTATLRFDTVKRRLTPDECEALRTGVLKLEKAEPILVTFEQAGEAYLAAGKVREALDEFNRLTALHPQEGLHHAQIARALLAAGIGEAARAEAQGAVKLDPKSGVAYQTLGWVLQHDLVGRRFEKGFDLAGAEAAYRKALEIDPSDETTRGDLAILLEHNAKGERYATGAKLEEAIREYKSIGDKLHGTNLEDNLLFALMWARRFKELRESAEKLPPSSTRRALILAATGATDSPEAAVKQALKDIGEEETRQKALQEAGLELTKLRLYPQAADLLTASAQGTTDAANVLVRAGLIRNVTRHEDLALPSGDPRSVVKKFFIQVFAEGLTEGEALPLLSRQAAKEMKLEGFDEARQAMRAVQLALRKAGLGTDEAIDLALGAMQTTVEGDDAAGYLIRMQGPGESGTSHLSFFVLREDGQYRILDTSSGTGGGLEGVGDEVLERVTKGDLPGARRLLDWAREEQPLGGGDDPLAGRAFPRFWTKGQQGDRDAVRYAAAALVAFGSRDNDKAIAILREGREKAASDEARASFDLALAQGLTKSKKYADALPVAQRLAGSLPESATAFTLLASVQVKLKMWQECERVAAERLKRLPDDPDTIRVQMRLAEAQGNIEKAQQFGRKLATMGKATPGDLNEVAWDALVRGFVDADAIEAAQRAALLSHSGSFAILHTLASLYADVGKTTEARQVLLQAMDVGGLEEPNEESWYVFGRIAEQFRVHDAATADYRRLKAPEAGDASPVSTYLLAQRRLKALREE